VEALSETVSGRIPWWQRPRKLAGRMRRRFTLDTFDVFKRPVRPEHTREGLEIPSSYTFEWGTADDIERCADFHTELDANERRLGVERLGFGHLVVVGKHDGQAVFTMWANPRNLNVPGLVKRRLRPGQWFIYKAYTSPEHRGRKLYETGMRFVLAEMLERGLQELVGYAHVKKRVSRKGLARLDFTSVGRVVQWHMPGWAHTRVSPELVAAFPEVVPRSGALDGGDGASERPA